jgi:hypothetical protein
MNSIAYSAYGYVQLVHQQHKKKATQAFMLRQLVQYTKASASSWLNMRHLLIGRDLSTFYGWCCQ